MTLAKERQAMFERGKTNFGSEMFESRIVLRIKIGSIESSKDLLDAFRHINQHSLRMCLCFRLACHVDKGLVVERSEFRSFKG